MRNAKKKTAWEREWDTLKKKEERILIKYEKDSISFLNKKLEAVVPKTLQEKLDLAFYKAFQLIFEKGNKVIEMTYSKKRQEDEFKIRDYAAGIKKNHKTAKAFSKQASTLSTRNLIFSGIEGIGLGILGVGIPDIPLFTGLILKSVYEIALTYGFSYESEEERYFILKLIQASLEHGEQLKETNQEINQWMEGLAVPQLDMSGQIKQTATVLSRELLYMKFLQGIPIAGVVGGLSDTIYLKRITDYAELKYKRRFLINKLSTKE